MISPTVGDGLYHWRKKGMNNTTSPTYIPEQQTSTKLPDWILPSAIRKSMLMFLIMVISVHMRSCLIHPNLDSNISVKWRDVNVDNSTYLIYSPLPPPIEIRPNRPNLIPLLAAPTVSRLEQVAHPKWSRRTWQNMTTTLRRAPR
jgi:hypothetical protein